MATATTSKPATPVRNTRRKKAAAKAVDPAARAAAKRRALSHPLRITIMQTLDRAEKPLSPSAIASEIDGAPLANVAYHVRTLHDAGFLKLVRTAPRRGAVEHYYAPTAAWQREEPVRPGIVDVEMCVLRRIVRDLAKDKPDKEHVQFANDGDELLLNLAGMRYRIFPDCTVVEEHPSNGRDGDDGDA